MLSLTLSPQTEEQVSGGQLTLFTDKQEKKDVPPFWTQVLIAKSATTIICFYNTANKIPETLTSPFLVWVRVGV